MADAAGSLLEEEARVRCVVHSEQSVCHVKRRRIIGTGDSGDGQAVPADATEQNGGQSFNADVNLRALFGQLGTVPSDQHGN
jgi:hypothetical protein